ncbi:sensor histidine kinase [Microbacterium sp. 4R-513]|uniref:sensor histidine kinase n=1 Tax=Microbacterium sp. 4R-513 TaxID=2567934 RepID=UPI0013E19FF4|nr:sensor histidine kinase [Microbacterium sp. 4R-513]QIG40868.1 sensor histidine kinase [Microbacterium sp. 4R-513]
MPERAWDEFEPRFRPPPGVTLWLPVVLSFVIQVPAAIAVSAWQRVPAPYGAISVALAAASALALIGARRWPGPTVALVAALTTVDLFVPPDVGPILVALAFGIIGAVVRGARLWALFSVGAAWLLAVTASGLIGMSWHPFRIALATLALGLFFAIGEGIRLRLSRGAERRAQLAERQRTVEQEERSRIARELHDVLAHSLSQISVQSGMGLHLFDREPERAREALANIRELSAAGLDEVRGVLSFLRGDESGSPQTAPLTPQPQLAELPRLVEQRTALGLVVRLDDRLEGDRPAGAIQTTAYRIAQEALTNVVRHSAASNATVTLERAGDVLVVSIVDDGSGRAPDAAEGGGIRGMRERAALAGGSLHVHQGEPSGTVVEARLPWAGPR